MFISSRSFISRCSRYSGRVCNTSAWVMEQRHTTQTTHLQIHLSQIQEISLMPQVCMIYHIENSQRSISSTSIIKVVVSLSGKTRHFLTETAGLSAVKRSTLQKQLLTHLNVVFFSTIKSALYSGYAPRGKVIAAALLCCCFVRIFGRHHGASMSLRVRSFTCLNVGQRHRVWTTVMRCEERRKTGRRRAVIWRLCLIGWGGNGGFHLDF